jgi:predicted  nucleic acid-binding Zn-ribbon protein
VAELEKDRDDTAKRETDVRRKAREVNSKARRLEDELETISDRARTLEQDLTEQRASAQKLQTRLNQAEATAEDARSDLEREKKIWEADLQLRVEEERSKWNLGIQSPAMPLSASQLRTSSPGASYRRQSPDPLSLYNRRATPRSVSQNMEMPLSPMDRMLDEARRPSSSRQKSTSNISHANVRTPDANTPQRQEFFPSMYSSNPNGTYKTSSNTPSLRAVEFDESSSPHRTINDMISVSTVGAGPSVQLVERMSAAVRRLESEKATSKEEMARLVAQRDEAREEVVALMREIDQKKGMDEKVENLERDLKDMNQRYQTTLEMLGEKSERVEELEGDVVDLKKMYRDLVQTIH